MFFALVACCVAVVQEDVTSGRSEAGKGGARGRVGRLYKKIKCPKKQKVVR